MQIKRSQRVAQLLKKEMGEILLREVKDPDVRLATITKVKITDDLKLARIYVSTIGDEIAKKKVMTGLERAKKYIRSAIGNRTNLRYLPELIFYYDDTADYVEAIDQIIKKIHTEDDIDTEPPA